jgi:hypothetical protein
MLPSGRAMLAIAAVAAGAAGFAGGWAWRGAIAEREQAEAAAHTATLREQAMHAALVETTRRVNQAQEIAHAADRKLRQARADAAAADAAAGSLREYASALAARAAACDPAAAVGSSPASDAGLVLAHMLGRLEAAGRDAAAAADAAHVAGSACERAYDALTQAKTQ